MTAPPVLISPSIVAELKRFERMVAQQHAPADELVESAARLTDLIHADGFPESYPDTYNKLRQMIFDAFVMIAERLNVGMTSPGGIVAEIVQDVAEAQLVVALGSQSETAA